MENATKSQTTFTANAATVHDFSADDARHKLFRIDATAREIRKSMGLLTEDEAAAVLGLRATSTLATWRGQRSGPRYVKLGKTVFYTQNALIAWINERVVEQDIAFNAADPALQVPKQAA